MLYLVGLGLNEKGISLEGIDAVKKSKRIYLDDYTVNFPYDLKNLEKELKKKVIPAEREIIESMNELLDKAKKSNICLLVYGSPLIATTHISLIEEARKRKIAYKIIQNASVMDAISETGLQIYKFGKITSIPNFDADSFIETVKDNLSINAHSLILIDIGLEFKNALDKLEKAAKKYRIKAEKIVVCENLGTNNSRIYYGTIASLKNKNIKFPFCFIVPAKLHFMEEEVLENFK
ncbi:MAG TPA: diphthine synthase [Candidatus Omnitrophota bacterium]|nr:diphthine synthase [Candidatus Omnitrophota bacterium]